MKSRYFCLVALLAFYLQACTQGVNLFSEFGNPTTDAALLFEAKQKMNEELYGEAITLIEATSATFQATRDVKLIKASALAGRCGLNFFEFIEAISADSASFFTLLMGAMPEGTNAKKDDCLDAVSALKSISTDASGRTEDENILMAFTSLATIGVILSKDADGDRDGDVDGSFNHCTGISESDYREIIAAVGNVIASLNAVSSTDVAGDAVASLDTTCDSLQAQTPPIDMCDVTDSTEVTADQLSGIKGVVGSNNSSESVGVGNCNDSVVNCALTCLL